MCVSRCKLCITKVWSVDDVLGSVALYERAGALKCFTCNCIAANILSTATKRTAHSHICIYLFNASA